MIDDIRAKTEYPAEGSPPFNWVGGWVGGWEGDPTFNWEQPV